MIPLLHLQAQDFSSQKHPDWPCNHQASPIQWVLRTFLVGKMAEA